MSESRPPTTSGTWLDRWEPEDNDFWESTGKSRAWRTLTITTSNLVMAFIVWFVVSALVVRLDDVGFDLSSSQLFWLAAMPGLSAGTLRIFHSFSVPLFGTRHVVSISTALLLLPLIGWFFAVQDTGTPYVVLLLLAFLAGLGGGNFSSFMPSTSLFFPKRLQGTALGIQAGIGNFGVSVVQFVTPWVIGFALVGSTQVVQEGDDVGDELWLQNAVFIWIPIVAALAIVAWFGLKSVPVRANVREQMDIFRNKHTWLMTSLYFMTFGSFAGFSAVFPLLIKELFEDFDNAPKPLAYAFLGPLVGSASRVIAGPIADRFTGGRVTVFAGLGLIGSAIGVSFFLSPSSADDFPGFLIFMLGLFFFAGIGNASTFKQMPMIFPPRQGAGVIGWTAAIAAYGPFVFAVLIAAIISGGASPLPFFIGAAVFYAINTAICIWFYVRPGAEAPC